MAKLLWAFCALGVWAVVVTGASHSHSHAPSPSVDCSSVLLSMADCLTFVMNGSTIAKPEGSCCSGFKSVLKENPKCLCEAFNNNNNLGVPLNMTKATTLPAACGVSTPPLSKCGISLAPAPSPSAPEQSPSVTVSTPARASAEATSPTLSQSSSKAITSSIALVFASLVVAACSSF
ncbi:hypothetical protein MRB53_034272 [Persea americana]|uniref:Uncharacterized protein n=1 Tax=Persea americana TaxID=3435 RepID=A0ACC2KY34_PERAE|nr:hypothetical protein MRB53_034272 [Persea americana]|eukprot:TRINITY_DN69010_c2_g1_i1.p1 TRINITY_DN69010_c2_g1~~TRINITY_DN69010_c2_g1_i1.p1  ORF type:complete len:177 (+),score=48.84 TRINITY_DN69010_c2_g1_i1:249-779(+)